MTSTVTIQPPSFLRIPVTPSAGLPTRADSSSRAICPTLRIVSFSGIVHARPRVQALALLRRGREETLQQLLLAGVRLLLVELTRLAHRLDVGQLRLDRGGVRPLAVRLLLDLLGHPDHPAHRRERQGEQARDQSHVSSPLLMGSRKEYGGWGPTYLMRIRSSCARRSPATASSKAGRASRSTRKAACRISCAPPVSFSATARVSGARSSSSISRSSSCRSSSASATAWPSSTCRACVAASGKDRIRSRAATRSGRRLSTSRKAASSWWK